MVVGMRPSGQPRFEAQRPGEMRKRYAVVGVGKRAEHFIEALLGPHREHAELAALCDASVEALREAARLRREGGATFGTYAAADFERMVAECRVESVLVLTPDHTHADYICRAMDAGCDVITEKPLTTDVDGCRRIVEARKRSGRRCRVTFNYRYAPWNTTVKRLILDGAIGEVFSVSRRHCLPAVRAASYFHRWNSVKKLSGGLLVHKSTHYFDLINFFVGSPPVRVYSRCRRSLFTDEQAARLGLSVHGRRCGKCGVADRCPYFVDVADWGEGVGVLLARGRETGYYRDECVFRPEADIPDTMHVMVEYAGGATCNYLLVAGSGAGSDEILYGRDGAIVTTGSCIRVLPAFGQPYEVQPPKVAGGHGGGDPLMFRDLFDPAAPADELGCRADHRDGVCGCLIGIAADLSNETGQPVDLTQLVPGLDPPEYVVPDVSAPDVVAMRAWMDNVRAARRAKG